LRIPAGLTATGGRPGCGLDIIGAAKSCPKTAFHWQGWVIGSSAIGEDHLVLVASPHPISNYARVVNGPAWYPGARVHVLRSLKINGWDVREVSVPASTNDGSAFAHHIVFIWTVDQHTYAVGFHDVRGVEATGLLNQKLVQSIQLIDPPS
jgi:hypothetical protein